MKRIIYLLVIVFIALSIRMSAEKYVPTIREGRVWEYSGFGGYVEGSDHVPMHVYHFIKFDGYVSVNGETYSRAVLFKRIFTEKRDGESENVLSEESKDMTLYFLREADAKVYVLKTGNGTLVNRIDAVTDNPALYEEVIYDWSLNDGDIWNHGEMSELPEEDCPRVAYGTPVLVGLDKCRVMSFSKIDIITFIEGVGVLRNGSIGDYFLDVPVHLQHWINLEKPGIDSYLLRVYDEDKLVYGNPVNYASSVKSVGTESGQSGEVIYDLSGRVVTERVERGIYIQGGKKLIIK